MAAGDIVQSLRLKYPTLGLKEIAEILKQLNITLGAARLSQLGKIARYVRPEWRVEGKFAEDYYAVVRHCDKLAKLQHPGRSNRDLEGTACGMVKQAIAVMCKHGKAE